MATTAAAASGTALLRITPATTLSSSSSSTPVSFLRFLRPKDRNSRGSATKKKGMVVSATLVSGAAFIPLERNGGIGSLRRTAEEGLLGLPSILVDLPGAVVKGLKKKVAIAKRRNLVAEVQMFIEKGILNCRFFMLIAVAGSLIGSILCFVEGCFLVLQAFFDYFHAMAHHVEHTDIMHLLIEAIDMFLSGTGMLNFGLGMYIMLVGSQGILRYNNLRYPGTNLSKLVHQMALPASMEMETQWLSRAKSKLGHAVVMILQAGTLEKFKNVAVATGLDLACFAAAILVLSSSVFLLSKLHSSQGYKSKEEEHA